MSKGIIQHSQNIPLLLEGIILQAALDYVKSGREVKAHPELFKDEGPKGNAYMACVRDYESSKLFFEGNFFLSFINGNRDAQQCLINKLNKIVDLPEKMEVREAVFDLISNKKKAEEVIKDEVKIKRFLNHLKSEGQVKVISKTNLIKVDSFYLNFRCKMLVEEISDCLVS